LKVKKRRTGKKEITMRKGLLWKFETAARGVTREGEKDSGFGGGEGCWFGNSKSRSTEREGAAAPVSVGLPGESRK